MKPRTRPRKFASIGSNQASPVNSDSDPLVVVISLFMAWSPAGAPTPGLGCWSQPETTPPQFQPHPRRHLSSRFLLLERPLSIDRLRKDPKPRLVACLSPDPHPSATEARLA